MKIRQIRDVRELETVRPYWEGWQNHPNHDFMQFKLICQIRSEVEGPCVTVIERNGQPSALLAGRLERASFAPSVGYLQPVSIPIKVITILHEGLLGKIDQECALNTAEVLWSSLCAGEADAVKFSYIGEDSKLLDAFQKCGSSLFCERTPRWSTHWKMAIPTSGSFLQEKVRAKHRTRIRKKERELESAYPGKVSWQWMTQYDDVPGLCARLEEVAARAYQRGLGSGFIDNEEFRQRFALFGRRGELRVQLLEIDGRVRAFWFGYLYKGVFHLSETGYDPDLGKYEVGTLMFMRLNDELSKEGVRQLDFGIGDALYKQRFGDESRREATVWAFAPTMKGLFLRSGMGLFATIDNFGRLVTGRIGLLNRLKTGWRRRLTPRHASADQE